MDLVARFRISGKSSHNSRQHKRLGNDPRGVLCERSGECRQAGIFMFARVCPAFNKKHLVGIPSRSECFVTDPASRRAKESNPISSSAKADLQSEQLIVGESPVLG